MDFADSLSHLTTEHAFPVLSNRKTFFGNLSGSLMLLLFKSANCVTAHTSQCGAATRSATPVVLGTAPLPSSIRHGRWHIVSQLFIKGSISVASTVMQSCEICNVPMTDMLLTQGPRQDGFHKAQGPGGTSRARMGPLCLAEAYCSWHTECEADPALHEQWQPRGEGHPAQ